MEPPNTRAYGIEEQTKITVLFACVHNAGRSQMASALFNSMVEPPRAVAISAGTKPASQVHPEVLEVMREIGIDLSNITPQYLTPEMTRQANVLVTMGCGEECPMVPGLERVDWQIPDPKGQPLSEVRLIRDYLQRRVLEFVRNRGVESLRP